MPDLGCDVAELQQLMPFMVITELVNCCCIVSFPALGVCAACAGCAVARGTPVGLDIERSTRTTADVLKLAKRRLTASEYELLTGV